MASDAIEVMGHSAALRRRQDEERGKLHRQRSARRAEYGVDDTRSRLRGRDRPCLRERKSSLGERICSAASVPESGLLDGQRALGHLPGTGSRDAGRETQVTEGLYRRRLPWRGGTIAGSPTLHIGHHAVWESSIRVLYFRASRMENHLDGRRSRFDRDFPHGMSSEPRSGHRRDIRRPLHRLANKGSACRRKPD